MIIIYILIHTVHLLSAFMYGGFLFVDFFFLSKMSQTLNPEEQSRAREAIMMHVRKVVPYSLFVAVGTGVYLISQIFGEINDGGLSRFQILLLIKALFGLWLGIRGFNQKVFKINPWVFTSHTLPFMLVLSIIILSQLMYA
ncbi:MAG: hypothetical protein PHQ22_02950 [Sulfuricurvum sp.]|nr:hypothetical protein [Sulfuricurvum sp.]MDD5386132.1 hypothetical protein [Sulfuricurvum sp.]